MWSEVTWFMWLYFEVKWSEGKKWSELRWRSWGQKYRVHYGDLILRVLDFILRSTFRPSTFRQSNQMGHVTTFRCLLQHCGRPCASDSHLSWWRTPVPGSRSFRCEITQCRTYLSQCSGTKWIIKGLETEKFRQNDWLGCDVAQFSLV